MSKPKLTLAQKVANLNTPLTWENIENKPPFGTEANTILEGSKFIEGLGVNGYGGTIQDPGQKVAGKCYFDINTKSLFLCKTTNNLTSPNSDYFTSFDNKSLLNKLENLYKYEVVFEGRANTTGIVLGTIPNDSRSIIIYTINYSSNTGYYYYFAPVMIKTEFIRNKTIAFNIGVDTDNSVCLIECNNNKLELIYYSKSNPTADNNYVSKIISINY